MRCPVGVKMLKRGQGQAQTQRLAGLSAVSSGPAVSACLAECGIKADSIEPQGG